MTGLVAEFAPGPGPDFHFCRACGHRMHCSAMACPGCGAPQVDSIGAAQRILPAALLCLCLGLLSAHRFYVGRPVSAILQIVTLGGLGFWLLADFVMLICGTFRNGEGQPVTEWV